nr:hypothetical protein GCM10023233_27830 [Brevibacterium otitidis]
MDHMRPLHTTALAFAGISMLLLSACGTGGGNGTVSPTDSPTASEQPGSTGENTPTEDPTETSKALSEKDIEGVWGSDEKGDPFLNFKTDGNVIGTDGCNGISTTYKIDGATVTLDPWASTMRACEGVDDWLQHARTLELTDSNENADEMTVKDKDGEEIGTLIREK